MLSLLGVGLDFFINDVSVIVSTGNAGDSIKGSLTDRRLILSSTGNAGELILVLGFSGLTRKGFTW